MVAARRIHFEPFLSSVLEVRANVVGRLAQVKLEAESNAVEPSLRRCLGHHGVFKKCVTASLDSHTQPAKPAKPSSRPASRIEPEPTSPAPKPRHAPEPRFVGVQVANLFKGFTRYRVPSVSIPKSNPEDNDLIRVRAHGAWESSSVALKSNHASPKMFFGLNPFARFKHKRGNKTTGDESFK
ncbi:uncharacterized protein DSM5745_07495 [Aspergillus mulundensis]|uniref:Uncharacterized protein n=1 Tax=Aspergillus mulundensis TaxID=1810919 RepID=A0A3D8RE26_9EURO|nr:hypothetical protein DSM5745_07495 [Aspergillus mulundensis]RDW72323.1 hypothetical protein DSM5745_07495 [Aspergillus mulundensis]